MRTSKIRLNALRTSLLALLALGVVSCSSAEKIEDPTPIVTVDSGRDFESDLVRTLEASYPRWRSDKAEELIAHVIESLLRGEPNLAKAVPHVEIVLFDTDRVFVSAGVISRIYLSRGALQALRFESELAFLIARQLYLIKEKTSASRIENTARTGGDVPQLLKHPFQANGLFDIGHLTQLQADRAGVFLMYRSYYDPRGSVSLLQRWTGQQQSSVHPESAKLMPPASDRLKTVRDEIAKLSPLRDPIITSHKFDDFLGSISGKNN